jgi:hypothetical protein
VDFSRRREKLPFTHHAVVASLEPDAQEYFLAQAEDKGWSKRQLECAIEAWEKGENPDGDNSAYHDSETAKPSPLWSPVEWRSAKIRQTQLWNADKGVLPLSKKAHLQIIREQIAFLQSAEKRLTGE